MARKLAALLALAISLGASADNATTTTAKDDCVDRFAEAMYAALLPRVDWAPLTDSEARDKIRSWAPDMVAQARREGYSCDQAIAEVTQGTMDAGAFVDPATGIAEPVAVVDNDDETAMLNLALLISNADTWIYAVIVDTFENVRFHYATSPPAGEHGSLTVVCGEGMPMRAVVNPAKAQGRSVPKRYA